MKFKTKVHSKTAKNAKLTDKRDANYDLKFVQNSVDTGSSVETKAKFFELISEFSDVFSKNEKDIGQCDVTAHKKQTEPGSRPIKLPNRRLPLHYKQDLQAKIIAFPEQKHITPCYSPFSAPAMLVPKKNGKLRLVIDYRQMNEQTIKSCWPIPLIEEIFDTLEEVRTLPRSICRGVSTSCQWKKGAKTSLRLVRLSVPSIGSACLWHQLVVRTPSIVLWNRSSLAWLGRQPSPQQRTNISRD